ncbi:MAG: VirB4 family type IV secretion system protein [Terriglobales bacterium]
MPLTLEQHDKKLADPALCEQLPVRDYLDNVAVRTNGAFVAGYELRGLISYFAGDEGRERGKLMIEALLRSLPEQSMRVQIRYEVVEDLGDLLERYARGLRSENAETIALDELRVERWRTKEANGDYMRPFLHAYFIWDPVVHHRVTGKPPEPRSGIFSLSARKSIVRTQQEHRDLLTEFESLLHGVETALRAADLGARRLSDGELFVETKRALNPTHPDTRPYRRSDEQLEYSSAREQIADASIVDETDTYLNIGGILYSFISLKELPDATFPGVLRELVTLVFPIVINAQITIPDQAKVLKGYKSRLRKMQAAQRDSNGVFRINVEAQVAEAQLIRVQQDIISSSVKTAKLSLVIGTRTSRPAVTTSELEQAESAIDSQRQQLLYAVARMNGAKAVPETLAKRRLFFSSLPAMADPDKRDQDLLTSNAADLVPVEMPWRGTPRSPLFLLETPYRQLTPFSLFDPGLSDANMLVMAKSGGGKTFMAQQFLLMAARDNPLISIIERGDSYRPLVQLMGGRTITMSLDTDQTINPWDLAAGEKEPSRDQVAFLKNLTRHMLGEGRAEDTELLDNLITEAILRTYKRAAIRPSSAIPTFSDLRDELAQWRDEEKNQRVMDEAHLAAIKLRSWTGEKGVYARLFDRPTTISLDNPWLFFNVEQLADDSRLETAMSLLIAHATAQRASGKAGRRSITVLDECWFLLDSPVLAPEVVQLFRTARKRNASVWGISQTAEDFVGTETNPRAHGAGIVKNSSTKIVGPQPGDMRALREYLYLNETALNQVKHFSAPVKGKSADALIVIGEKAETTHTIRMSPTPADYWIMTTYVRERVYRSWWLEQHKTIPLIRAYVGLADRFPFGLADVDVLPEEMSGEVARGSRL